MPHHRILRFLDRSPYVFFQVAAPLYSRGWLDPVSDPEDLAAPGIGPRPLDLQPWTLTTRRQRRSLWKVRMENFHFPDVRATLASEWNTVLVSFGSSFHTWFQAMKNSHSFLKVRGGEKCIIHILVNTTAATSIKAGLRVTVDSKNKLNLHFLQITAQPSW
jgi:hypothetical protein